MSGSCAHQKSPVRIFGRGFLCFLAGVLAAMSFVVSSEGYVGMSDAPASSSSYLWSALALCFALLFFHVYMRRRLRPSAGLVVFGLIFGAVNTFGGMLFAYDSFDMLRNLYTLLLAVLRSFGQALPMIAAFTWLNSLLRGGALKAVGALEKWQPARFAAIVRFYRAHRTLSLMLLFVLCWSPYLLTFYPGTVCWDLGEMAAQFFGQRPMDTWHPVFTTWLFGGCIWLGRLIGSDNLGALLFMLLQTAALSYALARAVAFMRLCGANRAFRLSAVAFFALTPLWGGYAQFISKDTLYTAALLLFTLHVLTLILGRDRGASVPARALIAMGCWALLTCLLRSNGLYVVLPTAIFVILFCVRRKARIGVACALSAAVAAAVLFSGMLVPALGIRDETASGLYSVCFQQSARVLRDHAQEVTPDEYAAIDRVLDAQNLAQLYEPWISDPVKFTFRQYGQGAEVEKAALRDYRAVWLSMLGKYPLTYAEAFFAGNVSYYAFTPKIGGETYNQQAGNRLVFETYSLGDDPRFVHTSQPERLSGARTLLAIFARGWRHIPLLSLLYCCAAYTWLLVGAGLSAAAQRRWRVLCGFLPALLSLGVCMLSPVNDYFRYFLPIVAMTFPLVCLSGCDSTSMPGVKAVE